MNLFDYNNSAFWVVYLQDFHIIYLFHFLLIIIILLRLKPFVKVILFKVFIFI
jgi:hypothetical protein